MPKPKARVRPPGDPPKLEIQDRDLDIFEALWRFEVIGAREIIRWFFSKSGDDKKGRSTGYERLNKLWRAGLIDESDLASTMQYGRGMFFTLTKLGFEALCRRTGHDPKKEWFRDFDSIRDKQLDHDIEAANFALGFRFACARQEIELRAWVGPRTFLEASHQPTYMSVTGEVVTRRLRFVPDGFFKIRVPTEQPGKKREFAFLLEFDNGTHPLERFAEDKVRSGMGYLASSEYQELFSVFGGRWLVPTTDENRLRALKDIAEQHGGNYYFWFCVHHKMTINTLLYEPVWFMAGRKNRQQLLPPT